MGKSVISYYNKLTNFNFINYGSEVKNCMGKSVIRYYNKLTNFNFINYGSEVKNYMGKSVRIMRDDPLITYPFVFSIFYLCLFISSIKDSKIFNFMRSKESIEYRKLENLFSLTFKDKKTQKDKKFHLNNISISHMPMRVVLIHLFTVHQKRYH